MKTKRQRKRKPTPKARRAALARRTPEDQVVDAKGGLIFSDDPIAGAFIGYPPIKNPVS